MDTKTVNIILDLVLVTASVWMIYTIRGIGGVVGKTLNWIVVGAVILGFAHLFATLTDGEVDWPGDLTGGTVHRIVVLVGFVVLAWGFRQLTAIRND
jgi:hypothetical protein